MASEFESDAPIEPAPRSSRHRFVLPIMFLLVFAGGAAAMGYALTHWAIATRYLAPANVAPPPPPTPRLVTPPPSVYTIPDATTDRRIAELEARLNRIDSQADAAESNADRAEGLLVAFAARRALDRGIQLGYIEALLRARFGAAQPRAVATIIAAGRDPVTLDELKAELSELSPNLIVADPGESWWTSAKRELSGLIVVRQQGTPSPAPTDRLTRAKTQLEAGHVAAAIAEVSRMPGRERAAGWIAHARRYTAARDALDTIETAALLTPHERPVPPAAPPPPTSENPAG
jgi:hypothetical protein